MPPIRAETLKQRPASVSRTNNLKRTTWVCSRVEPRIIAKLKRSKITIRANRHELMALKTNTLEKTWKDGRWLTQTARQEGGEVTTQNPPSCTSFARSCDTGLLRTWTGLHLCFGFRHSISLPFISSRSRVFRLNKTWRTIHTFFPFFSSFFFLPEDRTRPNYERNKNVRKKKSIRTHAVMTIEMRYVTALGKAVMDH